MNLNEAAEIVRNKATCNGTTDGILKVGEAYKMLWDTMLSELDPTPISEEWLQENGFVLLNGIYWNRKELTAWRIPDLTDDWATSHSTFLIKTLGELRTLLRLMGGGE